MEDKTPGIGHYLARIAALEPPKRKNIHAPAYWAQQAIHGIAKGEPASFSEAAWVTLPKPFRLYGLTRIRTRQGREFYIFNRHNPREGVRYALYWLTRCCKWRDPAASCMPTNGDRGRTITQGAGHD